MGLAPERGQPSCRIATLPCLAYARRMSETPGSKALADLVWLLEAGADEAAGEAPVDRFAKAPHHPLEGGAKTDSERGQSKAPGAFSPKPPARISRSGGGSVEVRPPFPLAPRGEGEMLAPPDNIGRAIEIAAACNSLDTLKAALEAFDGCALKQTAKTTVFADGTPVRHIMFIGEAPGAEEDRQGKPFVGRAGQLLDKMLAAIGLDRRTNAYITNVLNWRPPGNRDPSPEEAAICLPFLRRHIELVAPEVIVLLGATAVRHVLGRTDGIMRVRGAWLEYYAAGKMVPVMPTLHPAYLLRQPAHKKLAWRDIQAIEKKVNELGLLEPRAAAV